MRRCFQALLSSVGLQPPCLCSPVFLSLLHLACLVCTVQIKDVSTLGKVVFIREKFSMSSRAGPEI